MTLEQLMHKLETLTHAQRLATMRELGANPAHHGLIDQLFAGSVYQRLMATYSTTSSHHEPHIMLALTDTASCVRGAALGVAAQYLPDASVPLAVQHFSISTLRTFLNLWKKCKRNQSTIDQLFAHSAHRASSMAMLPFVSDGVLRSSSDLLETATAPQWSAIMRSWPTVALELFKQLYPSYSLRMQQLVNGIVPTLANRKPSVALELASYALQHMSIEKLQLQNLVPHYPHILANWVLQSPNRSPLRFYCWRLNKEHIHGLMERGLGNLGLQYHLHKLPASWRDELFQAYNHQWRSSEGIVDVDTISVLGASLRVQESHYHLGLPALEGNWGQRLPYAKLLGFTEAKAVLATHIKHPKPEVRELALKTLLEAIRYEPQALLEGLDVVLKRKHEQDPIRYAMVSALASLPPSIYQPQHLPCIETIVQDAYSAADTSQGTRQALQKWVLSLLLWQEDWVVSMLPTMVRATGFVGLQLQCNLRVAQRLEILLLPMLKTWVTPIQQCWTVDMIGAFKHHLKHLNGFVVILERFAKKNHKQDALELLCGYCPANLKHLVPELLSADETWIKISTVLHFLCKHRQDLLTPFLETKSIKGIFGGKNEHYLPSLSFVSRLTASQQRVYATSVWREIKSDKYNAASWIGLLAALPEGFEEMLYQFVSNTQNMALRNTAIWRMGSMNATCLPYVLSLLDNPDTGRIAIYAARRLLAQVPPQKALQHLQQVPMAKVTIAKEVLRIIGQLGTSEALQYLLSIDMDSLHRDVRIALYRALWDYTNHPRVWDILKTAALDSEPAVVESVAAIPSHALSMYGREQLLQVLHQVLHNPEADVRNVALRRLSNHPLPDPSNALLDVLTSCLLHPQDTAITASAVLDMYGSAQLQLVFDQLMVGPRQALSLFMNAFARRLYASRHTLEVVSLGFAQALSQDPICVGLRIQLVLEAFVGQTLLGQLEHILPQLHPEALACAVQLVDEHFEDLTTLASLHQHPHEALRRLALAAHLQLQPSEAWYQQLEHYKQDPSPMVASAAQFTVVPPKPQFQ